MVRDSEPSVESKDPLQLNVTRDSSGSSERMGRTPGWANFGNGLEGSFDYVAVRYRARLLRSG